MCGSLAYSWSPTNSENQNRISKNITGISFRKQADPAQNSNKVINYKNNFGIDDGSGVTLSVQNKIWKYKMLGHSQASHLSGR